MFSLLLTCRREELEFVIAELYEQHPAGITESESPDGSPLLHAFFDDSAGVDALLANLTRYGARAQPVDTTDWVGVSREPWRPVPVGSRFFLVPEWLDVQAPEGRLRIPVNPVLACGSGSHEATQLCLEALERYLAPGMTVLDVGAGSGILSLAASLLNADRVIACDIDPEAIAIARQRVESNDVAFFVGSVDAVASGSADLAVANISPEACVALLPDLMRCLRPRGVALLSGFETHRRPAIEPSLLRAEFTKSDWGLLVVSR